MDEEQKQPKKMTGPLFWIVLSIVAIDDLMDIFLTATGVGAFFASAFSFIIVGIIFIYLFIEGVPVDDRTAVRGGIGFAIEAIPGLSVLPGGILFLIFTRMALNNPKLRSALSVTEKLKGKKGGKDVVRKAKVQNRAKNIARIRKEKNNPNIVRQNRSEIKPKINPGGSRDSV